jgi:ABC-type nitrate/sulfonate/bicarbonate transport system substrate-binding protein
VPQHGHAQAQQPQRAVTVLYEFEQNSLPLLVALEQGYFSKKNIRIELQRVTYTSRVDLTSSSWDLSIGVPIGKFPDDKDLFTYIRLFQGQFMTKNGDMIDGLVVRSDVGIKTVDDLKGKSLVVPGLFPGLAEMFKAKGISWGGKGENSVTIILNTGSDYLGQGDGSYTWGEDALRLIKDKKGKFKILDKNLAAQYICDPYYLNVSIVRASLFQSDERLVWDALQALDEAIAFIKKTHRRLEKHLKNTQKKMHGSCHYLLGTPVRSDPISIIFAKSTGRV